MNNIRKYKPPHSGERALDKMLSTVLVYLDEAIRLDEQALLGARNKPCTHCDSTGKARDTFDKMCDKCTPVHCVRCGRTNGLTECRATYLNTFHLCRKHLAEERRES